MTACPIDLIDAAAQDRLSQQQSDSLQSHLSGCEDCRRRLDDAVAPANWWNDVQRLLDVAALDDPSADVADSSAADARLFDGDDAVGELKAAGMIDDGPHPEMLGKLGRYVIEREIGTGGMGVVLKGYDGELNRTVAIKVLAPHLARSGAARQRFVREGRAAAAVVHENVVAIHQVDTSRRLPTLVMRYVDGVSLQRRVDTVGPLPICDALRVASQTAAGLAAAHRQGIVHRDVKPANILVSATGGRVWITDFGLARAVDDASLTRTGFIAGTPHYMSPEQARGAAVGPASDLFSLGGVMYFMLAARPPWRAERSLAVLHRIVQEKHRPLWQLNPDVPREVSDLVDALLNKLPEDRPSSASEIQQKLESILSDLQNPIGPHSVSAPAPAPASGSWLSKPLVLVPLTAAVTALLMNSPAVWQSAQHSDPPTDHVRSYPVELLESQGAGPDAAAVALPKSDSRWELSADLPQRQEGDDASGVAMPESEGDAPTLIPTQPAPASPNGFVDSTQSPSPFLMSAEEPSIGPPEQLLQPLLEPESPPAGRTLAQDVQQTGLAPTTIPDEVWEEVSKLEAMLRKLEATAPSGGKPW